MQRFPCVFNAIRCKVSTVILIWTVCSTGASAASIQRRQANETNVLLGAKLPHRHDETPPSLAETLLTEGLQLHGKGNEEAINLGWEASGDGGTSETELTTEAFIGERFMIDIDGIESRMDDHVIESRMDDDDNGTENRMENVENKMESRTDSEDSVEEVDDRPKEQTTSTSTAAPTAAPPVRIAQKPVARPMASNALSPPPLPSPPVYTERKPFNPVPVSNNVWDVRVSTHALTNPAPPAKFNVPILNEKLDYDYSDEELPPSLPNLDIIPFVAADALVGFPGNLDEEDERLIHKTMREDLPVTKKRPEHQQQLNEKSEEAAPAEATNRRNLWLINGTQSAAVSTKINQSAVLARNSAGERQSPGPASTRPPAKFPILPPRPPASNPSNKKTPTDGPAKAAPLGFGGLRVESCNIYGQMYDVGKIIAELSTACSECKCTEIGVSCFNLKC